MRGPVRRRQGLVASSRSRIPPTSRASPSSRPDAALTLEGDALSRLIARSGYAASTEETRPQLNGVLLQGDDKRWRSSRPTAIASREATRKGAFAGLEQGRRDHPDAGRCRRSAARAEDATSPVEIEIAAGKNQAGFAAQVGEYHVQILTRLLEGPYPNYEQVIPREQSA